MDHILLVSIDRIREHCATYSVKNEAKLCWNEIEVYEKSAKHPNIARQTLEYIRFDREKKWNRKYIYYMVYKKRFDDKWIAVRS